MGDEWLGREVRGTVVDWKRLGDGLTLVLEVEAGVTAELEARCNRGHDLTQAGNASLNKDGYIRCKACDRWSDALRRRRAKQG